MYDLVNSPGVYLNETSVEIAVGVTLFCRERSSSRQEQDPPWFGFAAISEELKLESFVSKRVLQSPKLTRQPLESLERKARRLILRFHVKCWL